MSLWLMNWRVLAWLALFLSFKFCFVLFLSLKKAVSFNTFVPLFIDNTETSCVTFVNINSHKHNADIFD